MKLSIKLFPVIVLSIFMVTIMFTGCDENINQNDLIYIKGKSSFDSIQSAIDHCENGDIVIINDGVFYEHLVINESISLIGSGRKTCIIDGNFSDDVLRIESEYVSITGISFQKGGSKRYTVMDACIDIRSSNVSIFDCEMKESFYGVYLGMETENCQIKNCNIINNSWGICFQFSSENLIESNMITNNDEYGLYIGSNSNQNIISENIIMNNQYAIRVKTSHENEISKNTIKSNIYGLYLCCGSEKNMMYGNNFLNQLEWHAREENTNSWNTKDMGNYWDTYSSEDTDNDGIGDTPHYFSQNIEIADYKPLMNLQE